MDVCFFKNPFSEVRKSVTTGILSINGDQPIAVGKAEFPFGIVGWFGQKQSRRDVQRLLREGGGVREVRRIES